MNYFYLNYFYNFISFIVTHDHDEYKSKKRLINYANIETYKHIGTFNGITCQKKTNKEGVFLEILNYRSVGL